MLYTKIWLKTLTTFNCFINFICYKSRYEKKNTPGFLTEIGLLAPPKKFSKSARKSASHHSEHRLQIDLIICGNFTTIGNAPWKKMRNKNERRDFENSRFLTSKKPNLSFFGKSPTSSAGRPNYSRRAANRQPGYRPEDS